MPILWVALEDEIAREEIDTLTQKDLHVLARLMPKYGDPEFPYLGYFDPYCQTLFNQYQMKPFLAEWRRLYDRSPDERQTVLLHEIEWFAERCLIRAHTFLRFYGW